MVSTRRGYHAQEARIRAGLTLQELAAAAKVSFTLVANIEEDKCYSSLPAILAITQVLGIGVNEYLGFKPSRPTWNSREGSVGAHAKRVREELGMSRPRLSKITGISTNTIYCMEFDKQAASMRVVLQLAEALGISPDEYLGNPCWGWRA